MNNSFDDIQKWIANGKNLDIDQRNILSVTLRNLCDYQEKFLSELNDRLMNESDLYYRNDTKNWEIITVLKDNEKSILDNEKKANFFQMLPNGIFSFHEKIHLMDVVNNYQENNSLSNLDNLNCVEISQEKKIFQDKLSAGVCFIKCKYNELQSILSSEKKYKGILLSNGQIKEFNYELKFFNEFLHYEKILERTAFQYGINRPYIFNPMSRRAVEIFIDMSELDYRNFENGELDFCLEKNGLNDIFLLGKTLLWNVIIDDDIDSMKAPYESVSQDNFRYLFDERVRVYEMNASDNEFYLIENDDAEVKRYKENIYINCNYGNSSELIFKKIKIFSKVLNEEKCSYVFFNFFRFSLMPRKILRTKADILYVLSQLNDASYVLFTSISLGDNKKKTIYTYEKDHQYSYCFNTEKIYTPKKSIININVKNSTKEPSYFFEDYVSYSIAYLNYFYPSFFWVAKYDD